jgi:uncharacterized protein (DUF488 family)
VGPLFTLGHSTRSFEDFVHICQAHGVRRIADVRRFPGSRRSPHFARGSLEQELPRFGVDYVWIPKLGGRRRRARGAPPSAWRVDAFAAYADHMCSPEFRAGVDELFDSAALGPTAILCAEASPYRCHRRLIADWLELHDVEVVHLLDDHRCQRHEVTPFASRAGDDVVYGAGEQLALPLGG